MSKNLFQKTFKDDSLNVKKRTSMTGFSQGQIPNLKYHTN